MIQKIDIQNFGLFNNYLWNSNIGGDKLSDIFKKVNIIYGRNYSGKTTLSRIFRAVEIGVLNEKYINSHFSIIDENGNIITEEKLSSSDRIRVYNTDFKKENLSWFFDNENGEIKPFTLIGSGNILAKKRISEIENDLGSIEKQSGLFFDLEKHKSDYINTEASLNSRRDKLEQYLQKQANQKIKTNPYYVLQGENYNVTNIKNEVNDIINSSQDFILDEKNISAHKTIVDEIEKSQIDDVHIKLQDYDKYYNDVKSLIEKKITLSETIQELVADSLLQKWVDEGRSLHRNKKDMCAFCGGVITIERWKKIDAHFSKESEELKKSIEEYKIILEKSNNYIDSFWESEKITKDNYYSLFYPDYENIKKNWDNIVIRHSEKITRLQNKLQERFDDIFNPKTIEKIIDNVNSDIEKLIEELNLLTKRNNEKSTTLGVDKKKSRKLLRYSENARFLSEINYKEELKLIKDEEEKLSIPRKNIEDIEKKIVSLEEEKKQEEQNLNSEGEAAKKINAHILGYFGNDSLSLVPENENDDNPKTKFIIKRGNEIAYDLSEGECNLISFCYFIAKMEDELNGIEHNKLIIYIDDPVSSLDNNHIFFMFSLIETVIAKDKKYSQLFISTHNLEFLKYIKRLTIPYDDNNKEQINHFLIEKRKNDTNYRCFIINMPSYLKDYVTEYNFLFKEIYIIARPFTNGEREKYLENNFTLFYNLPNNMRRFLECYLFYRYPNTETPLKNLGKIFSGNIPALVNRVINEYSHLTWGDRGTLVMDIKEAETVAKDIIRAIMKDKEHFEALCESVGVDKNITI